MAVREGSEIRYDVVVEEMVMVEWGKSRKGREWQGEEEKMATEE